MAPSDLEISTDRDRLDVTLIHRELSSSYWAEGRPREVVERSIAHSFCFGAYAGGRQVGFGRVITDFAVHAYLADVFVVPGRRGEGIGTALIAAILDHPDLRGLRWTLGTRDAQELYARFGFKTPAAPHEIMRRIPGDG